MESPPDEVVAAAVAIGSRSPCAKSKRGVVIFSVVDGETLIHGRGHNAQPPGFACDGTAECLGACAELCEHAEAAAIRSMLDAYQTGRGLDLLHVKVVNGQVEPSGPPSCSRCSTAILADGRIARVWLLHHDGWRSYGATEFHTLSLMVNGRPVKLAMV